MIGKGKLDNERPFSGDGPTLNNDGGRQNQHSELARGLGSVRDL